MDMNELARLGVCWQEGVRRCAGHAELYEKFLFRFPDDPTFGRLRAAMAAEDWEEAFLQAHTLKGVAGNLSLDGLYQQLTPFVEQLREGRDLLGARAAFPALCRSCEELSKALCRLRG